MCPRGAPLSFEGAGLTFVNFLVLFLRDRGGPLGKSVLVRCRVNCVGVSVCFRCHSIFGDFFMSKRSFDSYFLPPPNKEEAQAWVKEWRLKPALHTPSFRASRLEPCLAVISTLLRVRGASLQMIADVLWNRHKVKVHRSTLCRFIQKHPSLRNLKVETKLNVGNTKDRT